MNRVVLIGNLTRDPELRTTQSGISCCQFCIAVNRRFKNADGVQEVDYINIIAWRQTAEACHRYLAKGRKVAVCGAIQVRSYDGKDGKKRHVTEIVADEVVFLTPKAQAGENTSPSAPASESGQDWPASILDDELPF